MSALAVVRRWLAALGCSFLAVSGASALTPEGEQRSAQRATIAAARAEANARFEAQRKTCLTQFVVTSCLNDALRTHRLVLADLRERDLSLNEADRREAGAARQQALEAKAAASAASRDEAPVLRRNDGPKAPPAPNPSNVRRAVPSPQAAAAAQAERREAEQRNEAAYKARVAAADAHREEVVRRNADKAARGKVAAPLPLPATAASAASGR